MNAQQTQLNIYNTLTRTKEPLVTLEPGKLRMYVCGMTVYDYCHIGHARVMVVFDMVTRYLRSLGYEVTYVRNITDIDDKIIRRAAEAGVSIEELTGRFIAAMNEDAQALGCLSPDLEPRATAHIDDIVSMIGTLVAREHAYPADNGDVYYDVSSFDGYGALSGKQVEDLRAGARVDIDEDKRDPLDFVLWKAAKAGEPSWPSPWGNGRPGWHIECSAMSTCCLGAQFDIHGGGADLQFPHHENEIAQSEGATGRKFVNLWMHNGFVRVDDEKMSKSLGNFFTVREVLREYQAEEIRLFILSSHYRSPLNYGPDQLTAARASLQRLYTALRGLPIAHTEPDAVWQDKFRAAMNDDFNTAEAMAVLFELAREINRLRDEDLDKAGVLACSLRALGAVLGILQDEPEAYLSRGTGESIAAERIEELIAQRDRARAARDWSASDRIRDELADHGVVLEDGPEGTSWRRE